MHLRQEEAANQQNREDAINLSEEAFENVDSGNVEERQNQENFHCARCTLPTDQRRNPKGVHAIFEVQARACR